MEERPGEDGNAPDVRSGSHSNALVRVRDFRVEGAAFLGNISDLVRDRKIFISCLCSMLLAKSNSTLAVSSGETDKVHRNETDRA